MYAWLRNVYVNDIYICMCLSLIKAPMPKENAWWVFLMVCFYVCMYDYIYICVYIYMIVFIICLYVHSIHAYTYIDKPTVSILTHAYTHMIHL